MLSCCAVHAWERATVLRVDAGEPSIECWMPSGYGAMKWMLDLWIDMSGINGCGCGIDNLKWRPTGHILGSKARALQRPRLGQDPRHVYTYRPPSPYFAAGGGEGAGE